MIVLDQKQCFNDNNYIDILFDNFTISDELI